MARGVGEPAAAGGQAARETEAGEVTVLQEPGGLHGPGAGQHPGRGRLNAGDAGGVAVGGEEPVVSAEAGGVADLHPPAIQQKRGRLAPQPAGERLAAQAGLEVPQVLRAVGEGILRRRDPGIHVDATALVAAGQREEAQPAGAEVLLEDQPAAGKGIREGGREGDDGVKGAAGPAEPRADAAAVGLDPFGAKAGREARARNQFPAGLTEERAVIAAIFRPEAAEVVRIRVGVGGGLVAATGPRAEGPAGGAGGGGRGGVEPQFLAEGGAAAGEVAEALVGGGRPVVVVAVAGGGAGDLGDRGEAQAGAGGDRAEAGAAGVLLIAAGLVAEGAFAVVVQGELVEPVAQAGVEEAALEPPAGGQRGGEAEAAGGLVAGVGGAAEGDVPPEAVVGVPMQAKAEGRAARRGARDEGAAEGEPDGAEAIASRGALQAARPAGGGGGGDEADEPAGGIGPEGPGLRTAEHLHLVHVEGAGEPAEAGEVEVIHQKAHRGIGRLALVLGVFADAAELEVARAGGAAGPGQPGDLVDEVTEVAGRAGGERGGVEERDAGGDPVEVGAPEVGGDADRGERHDGRGGLTGAGGGEEWQEEEQGGQAWHWVEGLEPGATSPKEAPPAHPDGATGGACCFLRRHDPAGSKGRAAGRAAISAFRGRHPYRQARRKPGGPGGASAKYQPARDTKNPRRAAGT